MTRSLDEQRGKYIDLLMVLAQEAHTDGDVALRERHFDRLESMLFPGRISPMAEQIRPRPQNVALGLGWPW